MSYMPANLILWIEKTARNKNMPITAIFHYELLNICLLCLILYTVLELFTGNVNAIGNAHLTQFRNCLSVNKSQD